ncbi:MAG: hypothetical protein IJS45_02815 [Clostridia bacterium]|nr:hypothetical protein [Clostridia bacterium]
MVKGCQRKTIRVKDTESRFYEEAYFVLRPGVEITGVNDSDIIEEAMKIANGTDTIADAPSRRDAVTRALFFVAGGAFGASLLAALLLVF